MCIYGTVFSTDQNKSSTKSDKRQIDAEIRNIPILALFYFCLTKKNVNKISDLKSSHSYQLFNFAKRIYRHMRSIGSSDRPCAFNIKVKAKSI